MCFFFGNKSTKSIEMLFSCAEGAKRISVSRYKADVFPEGSAIMKLTGNVVLKSAPLRFMLQSSEKNLTHASYVSSKSAVWTSDVLLSPLRLQRISTKTITTSRMGRNFLSKLTHVACLV
jgi:hypothetical protein